MIPIKSVVALFPSKSEKEKRTHGRYGAVNGNKPRKLMRTCSLRRPHRYTIINVSDEPRKWMLTNGATSCRNVRIKRVPCHVASKIDPRRHHEPRQDYGNVLSSPQLLAATCTQSLLFDHGTTPPRAVYSSGRCSSSYSVWPHISTHARTTWRRA